VIPIYPPKLIVGGLTNLYETLTGYRWNCSTLLCMGVYILLCSGHRMSSQNAH